MATGSATAATDRPANRSLRNQSRRYVRASRSPGIQGVGRGAEIASPTLDVPSLFIRSPFDQPELSTGSCYPFLSGPASCSSRHHLSLFTCLLQRIADAEARRPL